MDEFDYWRLANAFSLTEAAALICNLSPSQVENERKYIYGYRSNDANEKKIFKTVLKTLKNAILANKLKTEVTAYTSGMIMYEDITETERRYAIEGKDMDEGNTIVNEECLREWLSSRGLRTGFFFPKGANTPDYLNPEHEKYAPKLAAAIRAWQSVASKKDLKRTPKQELEKWLREHAAEFHMTDEDGKPIENAIGQCCQLANWNMKGGAPKTPQKEELITENQEPDISF